MRKILSITLISLIFLAAGCDTSTSQVSKPADPDKAATGEQQPPQPAQAKPAPGVLLDLKGNGTKSTQKFTAAGDWDLEWSYDCSKIGFDSNFIVTIKNDDGSMSFNNSMVNQLGRKDTGVEHYHKGGTYFLEVTGCAWTVKVTG
jgi:hypothetical protein